MPREKQDYRGIMESLNEKFPSKYELSYSDISAFVGCTWRTARNRYPMPAGRTRMNKAELARRMAT